ncbi:putative RNA-directed DNA polymerase from transposon BS [Trichonephila clavipes]|nr:putative RNA-directed DNA polymerase from transposon BS [Trichonephila clavipes]
MALPINPAIPDITAGKIKVWCKKWKLTTSPEKSSLLYFSRKRSTIPPLLKICDKPIPEVKSLKILGIIFDPNITWKNHINYLRQKGFKYLNAIKALSSPKIGTRSDHLLNIINATIRSIFDYGSQLFSFSSNSNRQKLEPIYNAALRLALGLPRNTPLDLLRAESMNGNINSRHNFLCQKFITKQIALKDWSPNASEKAQAFSCIMYDEQYSSLNSEEGQTGQVVMKTKEWAPTSTSIVAGSRGRHQILFLSSVASLTSLCRLKWNS